MHEAQLGGSLVDFLTGEERARSTYEDLRQDLLVLVIEKLAYERGNLRAHLPFTYTIEGEEHAREIDLLIGRKLDKDREKINTLVPPALEAFGQGYENQLLVVFVPGQLSTYKREALSMTRLLHFSLGAITDMEDLLLFSGSSGDTLIQGLDNFPTPLELTKLVKENHPKNMTKKAMDIETRLLHGYTGLLKSCCDSACVFPGLK